MTLDEARAIRHKGQLQSEQDVNDYALLLGAALCGYANLPLTVANAVLFGTCALNRLPKTAEEAIAAHAVYLPDRPDPRLMNLLK